MKQALLIPLGAVLILSVGACRDAASSTSTGSSKKALTDADAVKQLESDYLSAWEAKRSGIRTLYAEDAVLVVSDSPPKRGVDAISQVYQRYASNPNSRFDATPTVTIISEGGDLAYSQGTYVFDEKDPKTGRVERENGYYLLIFEKQPDGSWKVAQDVSSRLSKQGDSSAAADAAPIAAM